jgi:hypothetical protein
MTNDKTIEQMMPRELAEHIETLRAKLADASPENDELQDQITEAEDRLADDLFLSIDGEIYEIDTVHSTRYSYLPMLDCGSTEFYVAADSSEAGEAARKYWEDMAENDPKEFACIIGEETLIQWGLGRSAGPGSTHVRSLQEWLDLSLDVPEEQWASYDGNEREVDWVSPALETELGFLPEVAYRHN